MTPETIRFNPGELCSRKLWQLVNDRDGAGMSARHLEEAVAELAARRRYLAELQQIGALEGHIPEV